MRVVNFSEARNSLKNVIDQVIDDADYTVIARRDAVSGKARYAAPWTISPAILTKSMSKRQVACIGMGRCSAVSRPCSKSLIASLRRWGAGLMRARQWSMPD